VQCFRACGWEKTFINYIFKEKKKKNKQFQFVLAKKCLNAAVFGSGFAF